MRTVILVLQELLTHTSLETHKLDLMAEVSSLRLKLAAAEKDKRELEDRCRAAQVGCINYDNSNNIERGCSRSRDHNLPVLPTFSNAYTLVARVQSGATVVQHFSKLSATLKQRDSSAVKFDRVAVGCNCGASLPQAVCLLETKRQLSC